VTHVSRLHLSVSKPFSLRGTVLGYGYHELPPFRWNGAVLKRAEAVDGRVYLLAIREQPARSSRHAALVLSVSSAALLPAAVRQELVKRTRRALRLDQNLDEFYALCRREPRLRWVPRLGLGRLLRGTALFEDLVKTIAWTNTTWPQAVRMIRRLGELGDPCPVAEGFKAWPGPAQILQAGRRYLEPEARLGYRAAYILELAERVAFGGLDLEKLEGTLAADLLPGAPADRQAG